MKGYIGIFLLSLAIICASCTNFRKSEEKTTTGEKISAQADSKIEEKTTAGEIKPAQADSKIKEKTTAGEKTSAQADSKIKEKTTAGEKTSAQADSKIPAPLTWPRLLENEKGTLKVYQPQIDKWEKGVIKYRMAIELTLKNAPKPDYGAIWVKANTDTDLDERLVRIKDLKVSNISIQWTDAEKIKRLEKFINNTLKGKEHIVSLDRILADTAKDPDIMPVRKTKVKMDPPQIIVSQEPAVLLIVDGAPALQPIADTGLSFVVNANMDLFHAASLKKYYLFIGEQWLSSSTLDKGWQNNIIPPDAFKKIPDDYERAYVKDLLRTKSDNKVKVIWAKPPAELILIDGEPSTESIPGTNLMFVKNTEQNIFIHKSEGLYYYLSAGRWFKSKRLKGPWTSAGSKLPEDFSKIPEKSPKTFVRVSVPGTAEAKEAVVESQIPRKITVQRKNTTVDVEYHGEPQFESIEGTELAYAVNTMSDVIRYKDKYYCCYQGVWFISKKPKGKWKVCDTIPSEIYKIPPSNPKHNITYVDVQKYDSETVTFGYTSGYTGSYVNGDTVVQGTGHHYSSTVYYHNGYPYYYWYPYTYSTWGFSYYYYGGPYYYYPYYHYPYYDFHDIAYKTNFEGKYGSGTNYRYGPWSETHYEGKIGDTNIKTEQYRTPYDSWGETTLTRGDDWAETHRYSNNKGTVRSIETSKGGAGVRFKRDNHRGGIYESGDGDLYAGRDGNVYKKDENGWSKREGGEWNEVNRDNKESLKTKRGEGSTLSPEKQAGLQERFKGKTDSKRSYTNRDLDRYKSNYRGPDTKKPERSKTYGTGGSRTYRDLNRDLNKNHSARNRGTQRTRNYHSGSSRRSGSRSFGGRGRSGGGRRGGGRRR
jgi:hypothetical protein